MKLSICIPVYNGADTVGTLVEEIIKDYKNHDIEIVLVNDCSPKDNSAQVCIELAKKYNFVKFIDLRKNSGEHNAVMCALNYCTGDYAAIIDDDLQNPPLEILKLVDEAQKGYDVVFAKYHKKKAQYIPKFWKQDKRYFCNLAFGKTQKFVFVQF